MSSLFTKTKLMVLVIAILVVSNILTYYNYNNLSLEYSSLKADYELLKQNYSNLQSVKGVFEDKRLKVTSEAIPEFYNGKLTGYTVRVTVVNVGNEPLEKVYIWLFIFNKDNKLIRDDYDYAFDLYMGESYTRDFWGISDEMASYKVIALPGVRR